VVIILFLFNVSTVTSQTDHLASFSDPARLWNSEIERIIEEAFRLNFRTKIIGGRVMNIRLPFAMNNDRDLMLENKIKILHDGKGNPQALWPSIEELLVSEDFAEYVNALSSGREKVIVFDLSQNSWSIQTDPFLISRIKSGAFIGLPHRPHALVSGSGITESDVYNYLYCIGNIGVDCSGFVWHILVYVARQGGVDLGAALNQVLGFPRGADPALYAGTSFFNSRNSQVIPVHDEIRNLRPADVLLFRDFEGNIVHAAVIQSIDWTRGVIRYLQCNNIAAQEERGVHEAFIYFDPANTSVSLKDPSLHWTKKRFGAFTGEYIPFADDGERYRYRLNGGGRVVRLRPLVPVVERMMR